MERLLYRIGLGSPAVVEASFDLESTRLSRQLGALTVSRPVFVAGLARAGTTILTRNLHASGEFATSTYRDLPFPLAPNTWQAMSRPFRRRDVSTERGHGDGMIHNLDSPEAIEEVFWRHFCGSQYVQTDRLVPHRPSKASIQKYATFMKLVMIAYGRTRYLAKNNNNVLRLPAILDAFGDSIALIPFRDPLFQAASLLNQHLRGVELHREDPFRGKFMHWLGHHEFGADQRPFVFGTMPEGDTSDLDYWLSVWTATYGHLADISAEYADRVMFVDYDRLCIEPSYFGAICRRIEIPLIETGAFTVQPSRDVSSSSNEAAAAARLHHRLREAAARHCA